MVEATSKKLFDRWVGIAVAFAIAVFGGLSLVTVQLARDAQMWVSHTQTVITEAKALLASMTDAETGERGYSITRNDTFLQPFRNAQTSVPLHVERLKLLVADNPTQQARLALIQSLVKAKLEILGNNLDAYRHGASPPIDFAAMDKFRLAEAAFEQEEERLYADRQTILQGRYALMQSLSLGFALLTGVAAALGMRKYGQLEARALAAHSEEQLRLSIESAPVAIAMFDRDMRYIAASRRFADDYRVDWDSLVGRSHYDVFPEAAARWRETHRRCLNGSVERCAEDAFPRVDGATDWLSWEIRPWYDPSGAVNGVVLWSENITQKKKTEAELSAAKVEAERANLAKSKFLAAASHDLRQPVQSLTLLLSVIERQVADMPKTATIVETAKTAMASLNGMLSGILEISRLDAGVIKTAFASVDLGELFERLAREYAPRAAADGLVLRHAPSALRVRADGALLERILRNLIENALRYTSKGGVLIGARQRGENVRLDVIDTGIGIASDHLTEIFEEFRQLNNPARDSSQGMGLGLSIVSRLAHLMGAEVQVASRVGHGTRFSLLLPRDRSASPPLRIAPNFENSGGSVLIIEDNSAIRQAYEIMLKDWGYDTLSAASGEEALDRAEKANWGFDAIIADHRLGPGLTGNVAATEIARRAGRSFPTMLVTGDTAEERLTEVAASGFAMLHKPVEADDLRRILASLLRGGGSSWVAVGLHPKSQDEVYR